MPVFPKISLRVEVENYLKEGFMNNEVGQMNMLDICKHKYLHNLEKEKKSKRKPNLYSCCFLLVFLNGGKMLVSFRRYLINAF